MMEDAQDPQPPVGLDLATFRRRQRQRNYALLAILLGLVVLFFAITMVQLSRAGHL